MTHVTPEHVIDRLSVAVSLINRNRHKDAARLLLDLRDEFYATPDAEVITLTSVPAPPDGSEDVPLPLDDPTPVPAPDEVPEPAPAPKRTRARSKKTTESPVAGPDDSGEQPGTGE